MERLFMEGREDGYLEKDDLEESPEDDLKEEWDERLLMDGPAEPDNLENELREELKLLRELL